MEKEELVTSVAEKAQITKGEATKILDAFIASIKEGLVKGEKVTILGFGTFTLRKRKALTFINPKTQKQHDIPERVVPHFKAGSNLAESLKS
ncbi:MAG: DNA-binding protein HU [Berkelbacteria bacterium GW2011_GWA1_36_9]|uniref:DNA-binding protein HU n=1 Tax=Berkelbacteria bacterium GW2011_GWA1_36_9 TaxID=1618331 RepID=A0A0G0I0T5_9BACT|nr:MAG: DNA-binding protein HU [Berkelbacteria bacterium GW2011_GWA1_36_9]